MKNSIKRESAVMPYTLEFVRFVGGFVLVISMSLIVLHVVSISASGLHSVATARGVGSVQVPVSK